MELVKNKASGKIFIVLDDSGGDEFLVITPDGKIKTLERRLFASIDMLDQGNPMLDHRVSLAQRGTYADYVGD
ncbi:hypothetical protein JCM12296A_60120 [Desulfosarcina cetonica]|uniref:hypothetical protein n=1 Tax=Desulfosarcina cetonica TaxID=90730 RepID=UPI0006D09888|nr:hypothetical protein [Desulfosarcina cetonica]